MDEPIRFMPLRRNVELTRYLGRDLPHWRQEGCTYFVTFRTADSLPATTLQRLKEERQEWLKRAGADYGELPPELLEEFTRTALSKWNKALDLGSGACHLRNSDLAELVGEALSYFDGKRMRLGDYIVMPNHVHALMTPFPDFPLEKLLASIKGVSARKINEQLGRSGEFWQNETYDHLVRTADSLLKIQQYIQDNPAKAGLDPDCCVSGESRYLFH